MGLMGLCGWIVFGFFAGLIARAIMPGEQRLGIIATTLLGVAGAFVGGIIGAIISGRSWQVLQPSGFIGAVIGAVALLVIGEMLSSRRRR
jgi:uncharacterized membrane protein YeaQ/YmgE (transglycosylase-associated protein family)